MDKKDMINQDINVEDYIEVKENTKKRRSKKLWISVTGVVVALGVAISAIGISSAAPEVEPVSLTLSDAQDESGIILSDVSDIVEQALPSVVSITSRTIVNSFGDSNGGMYGGDLDDIINFFFGDSFGGRGGEYYYREAAPEQDQENEDSENSEEKVEEIDAGMGSGTIIAQTDDELLILTSYHVVEGSSSLYVTFNDGASVDGTIKSADEGKDIAIVSVPVADIEQETLDAISVATLSTQTPQVGEGCIVIGNALGYGISVTTGIVSALDRDIYCEGKTLNVLQTDAAINNGNSGGCMLNERGEIIGINEAKVKITFVEGMCYAIPVYSNLDLIDQLINSEGIIEDDPAAYQGTGAFLGIRGRDVTDDISNDYGMPKGIYVSEVVAGSGAKEAGIQGGDIIIAIDDKDVAAMTELQAELAKHSAGDEVVIEVMRNVDGDYASKEINVTLTDWIS